MEIAGLRLNEKTKELKTVPTPTATPVIEIKGKPEAKYRKPSNIIDAATLSKQANRNTLDQQVHR